MTIEPKLSEIEKQTHGLKANEHESWDFTIYLGDTVSLAPFADLISLRSSSLAWEHPAGWSEKPAPGARPAKVWGWAGFSAPVTFCSFPKLFQRKLK